MLPSGAGHRASEALKAALRVKALEEGFDALRICRPSDVPEVAERLNQFLKKQYHGQMTWLKERKEWRGDPSRLWPDARSVIMLAHNYGPEHDPLHILREREKAAISVFAQNKDYHNIIKKHLKSLARWLIEEAGGASSDGTQSLLDKKIEKLDQRTQIIVGSKNEVERVQRTLEEMS